LKPLTKLTKTTVALLPAMKGCGWASFHSLWFSQPLGQHNSYLLLCLKRSVSRTVKKKKKKKQKLARYPKMLLCLTRKKNSQHTFVWCTICICIQKISSFSI
jgi:hypothetical protein